MRLIEIRCPACQARYRVGDVLLDKVIRCPTCREIFRVQEGPDEAGESPDRPGPTDSPSTNR